MIRLKWFTILLLLVLASGCATPGQKLIDTRRTDATERADAALMAPVTGTPYYVEVDEYYVGGKGQAAADGHSDTATLDQAVMHRRQYPVTLQMLAEHITSVYGVPVRITPDAIVAAQAAAYDPVNALNANRPVDATLSGPGGVGGAESSLAISPGGAQGPGAQGAILVQYEGTLRGLFDLIATRTGNAWRYADGVVTMYNRDTRTFRIHTLPGSSALSATISNQNSGGGGAGGGGGGEGGGGGTSSTVSSGNTTTVNAEVDLFDAAAEAIAGMLSPTGTSTAAAALGTVTVNDVGYVLDRVQSYVDAINHQMTQQVVLDVRVYSIELSQSESFGINWDVVWQSLNGMYAGGISTFAQPLADSNSLNLSIVDPTHNYVGSGVLLDLLSAQGNLSVETSASVATLSGQPVPVQVAEETAYLAEIATVLSEGGSQTSATPGLVTTGFSLTALPVVIDDSQILLQLQVSLSTLREIRQIGNGNSRIEAPQVDSRQFLQRVKIASGATLILSGFEQERLRSDLRGVGRPDFSLFGGGKNGDRRRTVLVVMLTPRIVG